jgi:hypothetical protein
MDGKKQIKFFFLSITFILIFRTICGRRVRVEHARPTGNKKGASFGRGYLRQRSPGYR